MKLVSYQSFGQARFGAVIGAGIVDMARASAALAATDAAIRPLPATIEPFLAQTDVLDASARAVVTAAEAGALRFSGGTNAMAAAVYGPSPLRDTARGLIGFEGDLAEGQAFIDLFALR